MRFFLCTSIAVAALVVAGTAPAARVATHGPRVAGTASSNSINWAGYAADGGPFKSVTASWRQPSVQCAPGETSYSSFWVGLDGDTDNTVEQIGTDSDCVSGTPTYYVWYEMYPKGSATLATIQGGDRISAGVSTDGNGNFVLTLSVNGVALTPVQAKLPHAALSSAEVIAEAPASNHGPNGILPLTDFGTVNFTGATVDGQNIDTEQNLDEIDIVQNGTPVATTSAASGGSFSVTFDNSEGLASHGQGHSK